MEKEDTIVEKEDAAFVPDVLPEDLPMARRAEAAAALRKLTPERAKHFEALVKTKWNQMLLSFPKHCQAKEFEEGNDGQAMKKNWMYKNYYVIMQESIAMSDVRLSHCGSKQRTPLYLLRSSRLYK